MFSLITPVSLGPQSRLIRHRCPDPGGLQLAPDDLHVWIACPAGSTAVVQRLQQSLTPSELTCAAEIKAERYRHSFVRTLAILRHVLCHYAKVPPQELQFGLDAGQCPVLLSPAPMAPVHFGLARWGPLTAVALQRPPGLQLRISHGNGAASYGQIQLALASRLVLDIESLSPVSTIHCFDLDTIAIGAEPGKERLYLPVPAPVAGDGYGMVRVKLPESPTLSAASLVQMR